MNAQGHVPSVPPSLAQWIDVLPVPVMLLDRRGRILSINQAWEESATPGGLMSPQDHRGKDHLHDLETGKGFAYDSARDLAAGLRSVLAGKQQQCTVLYDLDEGASWEAVVHRMDDDPVAAVLVHVDRTGDVVADEVAAEADRLAMELEAREARRLDQETIIHQAMQETHGPLTPIRLRLHQLRSGLLGTLSDEQRVAVDQIARNVEAWWGVQQEMLAALHGDAGRRACDLGSLLDEVLPQARERALRAGIKLEVHRAGEARIDVEPAIVRQAMSLLLDHALRATPAGGNVRLALIAGHDICLTLEDEDADATAPWAGLRLAKQVLQAQGGRVVDDAGVRGRSITLCFPRAEQA